jgi:hypothetical protein
MQDEARGNATSDRVPIFAVVLGGLGLVIPGGLFLWWLLEDATSLAAVLHDKLALAFVADVFVSTAVIAVFFARVQPGRWRWPWFVALCLLSTLAFGFVIYWGLNARRAQR